MFHSGSGWLLTFLCGSVWQQFLRSLWVEVTLLGPVIPGFRCIFGGPGQATPTEPIWNCHNVSPPPHIIAELSVLDCGSANSFLRQSAEMLYQSAWCHWADMVSSSFLDSLALCSVKGQRCQHSWFLVTDPKSDCKSQLKLNAAAKLHHCGTIVHQQHIWVCLLCVQWNVS